jgi:hypothetical protein
VSLQQAHNGDLVNHRTRLRDTEALPLRGVHVASLATDEGFVSFDVAAHLAAVLRLQREAETREHEPRGFLGHSQSAGEFIAADAVLGTSDQPERRQPLLKRHGGILEQSADLERELRLGMVRVALPATGVLHVGDVLGPAMRATNETIGPAHFDHDPVAVLVVREEDDRVLESLRSRHE